MGLGILGRGVGVAEFLADCGAKLTITDLKSAKELRLSLKRLKKFKNIKFVLGRHKLEDFRGQDLIIKAAGVPIDSIFIKEARKNKIPVEMDASLFARLAKGVKIIGITGTRGKSTTTHLLYKIIKNSGKRVFLGGNVKGVATLPLLKKIKDGDIVILELDSWQLEGFGESKISPHIAIFTTFFPDHLNYYKGDMDRYFQAKANIYKYQNKNDLLFVSNQVAKIIKEKDKSNIKSKLIIVKKNIIPKNWKINILGEHNLENIALAVAVARTLGVKEKIIKKSVEKFNGVFGRLELIRNLRGIKFYNDTTATSPEATIAAVKSFKKYKNKIILIGGGADKNLDYKDYAKEVSKYVKFLILFDGEASEKIIKLLGKNKKNICKVKSMKEALNIAMKYARKGDIILLSPGAASFGIFKNEFDRGEKFVRLVKKLK